MKLYLGIALIVLVSLFIVVQCNPMSLPKDPKDPKDQTPHEPFNDGTVTVSPPFTIAPINEVDDYEHNLIFQNEGTKAITKANRDLLMSAYPMDWSTHPPSSSVFEQGQAEFFNDLAIKSQTPQTGNPYARIEGFNTLPPASEKEILATYVPKKPQELTTYDAADAKEIIDKIYSARGQIADMKQSSADPNVF